MILRCLDSYLISEAARAKDLVASVWTKSSVILSKAKLPTGAADPFVAALTNTVFFVFPVGRS
jgi:hypothetical protein